MTRSSRRRGAWRLRFRHLAPICLVVLGSALVPTGSTVPAGAGEEPAVVLTPGKPVHIDAPAIQVPGYAATRRPQGEQTPANCRGVASSYCDLYPLTMDVPAGD